MSRLYFLHTMFLSLCTINTGSACKLYHMGIYQASRGSIFAYPAVCRSSLQPNGWKC
jgi:hypothetical protein